MQHLVPLVMVAALATTSGCAMLVAPPVLGATTGLTVAGGLNLAGSDASYLKYAVVGTVVGLAIDVVIVELIAATLHGLHLG